MMAKSATTRSQAATSTTVSSRLNEVRVTSAVRREYIAMAKLQPA